MGREIWFGTIFAVLRKLKKLCRCVHLFADRCIFVVGLGGAKIRLVFRECFSCQASEEKSSAGSSVELVVRMLKRKGGTWTRSLISVLITVVAVRCEVLSCSGVVAWSCKAS